MNIKGWLMDIRLIYYSMCDIKADEIKKILVTSEKNNDEQGITGLLLYRYKFFFQMLEGEREKVNALYNKIVVDNRHSSPTILYCSEIETRIVDTTQLHFFSNKIYSTKAEKMFGPFNALQFNEFTAQKANAFCNVIVYTNNFE